MEGTQKLTRRSKISYGLGAVGKDMVYMLSASYVLYYFQDLLGVNAVAMGIILMAARVFDAFNDPIMGVVVAKTRTRWGRFRPWLLIGTITNAVVLFVMFAAPPKLDAAGLTAYAAVTYILWGVTYTMMDIPYWSMIPAFTEGGRERENLTTLARTCAGVGSAIITIVTMMLVPVLGGIFAGQSAGAKMIEIVGFKYFSLIVAVIFVIFTALTCLNIKEKSTAEMETVSVGQMFRALLQNDQAMTVTVAIVLINCSIYITSNLVIYFFKYDFGGANWRDSYTLFTTVGGAFQILGMMILYPALRRRRVANEKIFRVAAGLAVAGYLVILALCLTGVTHNLAALCVPGALVFAANGVLSVLTTVFLSSSVDYGELQTGRREESVIFSLQTFVVKAASGLAVFLTGIGLNIIGLEGDTEETGEIIAQSASTLTGLRLLMTILPMLALLGAILFFRKRFRLTDAFVAEISQKLPKAAEERNAP